MQSLKKIILILVVLSLAGLAACGGGSDDDYAYLLAGTPDEITHYSAAVRSCAPYLASSATVLDQWLNGDDGWSRSAAYGVFNKHFNPDSGLESIYGPIDTLDDFIDEINRYSEYFSLTDGSYSGGGYTVTLSSVSSAVTIPFFTSSTNSEVNRRLQIAAAGGYPQIDAYFLLEEAKQVVVLKACYQYGPNNSVTETIGGYVAQDSTTGDVSVWLATFVDGPADDFAMASKFEGNTVNKTFDLTLKTNAAQGWAVMAGGSVAADSDLMAVRATDEADTGAYGAAGANDHANLDADEGYYVILTKAQVYDPTDLDAGSGSGWPKAVGVANVNLTAETADVADYIRTAETACPGWTLEYPASAAAIGSF